MANWNTHLLTVANVLTVIACALIGYGAHRLGWWIGMSEFYWERDDDAKS